MRLKILPASLLLLSFFFHSNLIAQSCSCIQCSGNVIVVNENVTINFNTDPPTYTGDADLLPFFTWDKTGPTEDTWKAIFNMGANKLLIKNGATITVTCVPNSSTNQKAPGIVIKSNCDVEIENGGHIIVSSQNLRAGDILIDISGQLIINGEVKNEVRGTNGMPGALTLSSSCGNISIGGTAIVQDLGVDPGGNLITISTCGSGCLPGDIVINGLVKSYAHAHVGDMNMNRPDIKVVSTNGAVTINANTTEPLYDEFVESGTYYDIWGGLLSWVKDNAKPGKIQVQAKGDITVTGHGDDPTGPVRSTFGAIAAIATASNAPGGAIDVISLEGNITGNNRAFDVSGRNRLSTNYAHINLAAKQNIFLNRPGANNTFNPVVDASSSSIGDNGGRNDLRSYSGSIIVGTNALVSAAVPLGSGSTQGTNNFTACVGVTNNGSVTPADTNPADDAGTCSPVSPSPLYTLICPPIIEVPPEKVNVKSRDGAEQVAASNNSLQSFPNPSNGLTIISYNLPASGTVSIKVFDILGKQVANLFDAVQSTGKHTISWNSRGMKEGLYIIRLTNDGHTLINKQIHIE